MEIKRENKFGSVKHTLTKVTDVQPACTAQALSGMIIMGENGTVY